MKTEIIKCESEPLKESLLQLLKGKVFHVAPKQDYKSILEQNQICNNKNGKYTGAGGNSGDCYCRKRGLVPLIDLRSASESQIEEVLSYKYNFLNPPNAKNNPVFFITDKCIYSKLISWETAKSEIGFKELYIPYLECWFPGDLSLDMISEAIEGKIPVKKYKYDGTFASLARLANQQKENS